jgi:putative iron-regulated protein
MRKTTLVFLIASLAGCDSPATTTPGALTAEEVAPVLQNYSAILHANYDDAVTAAASLNVALEPLTTGTPTEAALATAREEWIAAREPYMLTEAARFYNGPIDNETTGLEGQINSWPMDEAYVDYVAEDADAGLVNDATILPTIDAAAIAALNQVDSEEGVSTGWHAIEFLLWGQDLSDTGPGARPYTDFLTTGGTAANQDRRRAYLAAVGELLVEDITTVRDAWAVGASYRTEFEGLDPETGIGHILTGIGSLAGAELAGERINVAYTSRLQEDEHSCFSDTTLSDHRWDAESIRNLYVGSYTRTDGTVVSGASVSSLVAARDPALDQLVRDRMDAGIAAIEAIPGTFDTAIVGADTAPGRVAVAAARDAMYDVQDAIEQVAELLDVPLALE